MPPCEGSECPPPLCNLTTVEGKPCGDVFGDGVCNAECDNEECLKDGFDCRQVERTCPERCVSGGTNWTHSHVHIMLACK